MSTEIMAYTQVDDFALQCANADPIFSFCMCKWFWSSYSYAYD